MEIDETELKKAIARAEAAPLPPTRFEPPPLRVQAKVRTPKPPAPHFAPALTGAAFRASLNDVVGSTDLLNNPHVTKTVLLDKPTSISVTWNNQNVFKSSAIESFFSRAKLQYKSNNQSASCYFSFLYYWANTTGRPALVDIYAPVVLKGLIEARGAGGLFSGSEAYVSLGARPSVYKISGWGSDPLYGDGGGTVYAGKGFGVNVHAKGSGWWSSSDTHREEYSYDAFDTAWERLLVPNAATMFIGIYVTVWCSVSSRALDNLTRLEFADGDNAILSPYMVLTVRS